MVYSNVVRYRKVRAAIIYYCFALVFCCCTISTIWIDRLPWEFLEFLGAKITPAPQGDRIIFAIIFVSAAFSWAGILLTYTFEKIERHAEDDNYYKVKKSFLSMLIEGRYVEPVKHNRPRSVLPESEIQTRFNVPGNEAIFDDNLQLKVTMADFVKFCHKKQIFKTYRIEDWRLIDRVFHDKKGDLISAEQLSQSYRDLQQKGKL